MRHQQSGKGTAAYGSVRVRVACESPWSYGDIHCVRTPARIPAAGALMRVLSSILSSALRLSRSDWWSASRWVGVRVCTESSVADRKRIERRAFTCQSRSGPRRLHVERDIDIVADQDAAGLECCVPRQSEVLSVQSQRGFDEANAARCGARTPARAHRPCAGQRQERYASMSP